MTVSSTIRKARQLITPKGKWTQEALARDKHGNEVKPSDSVATCFCMIGAIYKVAETTDDYSGAIRALRTECGGNTFAFNDTHGKKTVLSVMDKAAQAASAGAA